MRASTAAPAVLIACLAWSGCGGDDDPDPLRGPAKEVAGVVQVLQRSLESGDYRRICRDLLTEQVRKQAGGRGCPAQLERTTAKLKRPRIAIRKISVDGRRATAEVTTRARGEAPAGEKIELVREDGRFRISSLGR